MQIQGSSEEEIGPIISVVSAGIVTLQVAHRILREYFIQDRKLESFEILQALKSKGIWQIKCYVEYVNLIKVIEVEIGTEIEQVNEIYREIR